MVNNLELIKPLLEFKSEDDFYFLQIIKRKKEHPELGSNNHVIRTYYISSINSLELKFDEIKSICDFHNARAYINLTKRSFEKIAFHTLRKVTEQIMNKDFKSVKSAYDSVCGTHSAGTYKKWIVDIDSKDLSTIKQISDFIYHLEPMIFTDLNKGEIINKVITTLPTKNGVHLITYPFNLEKFSEKFPEIDVHKQNPTILYING